MKKKQKNSGPKSKKVEKKVEKVKKSGVGIMPLGARVLIRPFTKEELAPKNSFGIILPPSDSKEKSEQGVVIEVGPGEYQDGKRIPVALNVGDKVAFSKYGFEDINIDGEEYYLIKEENILAILR